ncbi:MAG: phosphomannomutase/phosphoglucomutase [Bradymonadaceae bacterium]|nr:phosphomannomutase/phosphoglucomutase [Lujinxingiaceae bacterium]
MNPDIFRAYDIRGIADSDLTNEVVFQIGRAVATMATRASGPGPRIGVGRDARVSADRIFDCLQKGMIAAGAHVVSLGVVPTPLVYFAAYTDTFHACVQITGSHNPGEYNGFKMMVGKQTLHGDTIQELRTLIETNDLVSGPDLGASALPDLRKRYIEWVRDNISVGPRKLKIAVDSGNGVAGVVAPELLRDAVGCKVVELFSEPDGTFPNHHADPTVLENLADLIEAVQKERCDFGVAYDGDGDRIGVVDEKGEVIWGDKLMILLSRYVLKEHPGATIIGEVKCSQTLFDDIAKNGGVPIMSRVGHSLIKAKIAETNAKLAGEMSGHIFFNDRFFGFDDALYATCRLIEIVSSTDQSLSELLADVPETFATPELRRDCSESVKFQVPAQVAKSFEDRFEVNTIDGVRINFVDGWGLVRASNTQPVLVMRVEAQTPEDRDRYLAMLEQAVCEAERALA